jgi:ligand-binding SRPBCC domain-containing protein
MRHTYQTTQWVPFSVPEVFAFFCDPDNLPKLMPAWQKARIDHKFLMSPPLSPIHWPGNAQVAGQGSVLTITFRPLPLLPVRLQWVAIISEFAWNDHFCDEQKTGPLAYWKHCHSVTPETQAGVAGSLVTDTVTYSLPLGFLGDFANALAIERQMKSTFAFRQAKLSQLLSETIPSKKNQARSA